MPTPAITQAITAPNTPVAWAKFRGSENTPAPTIDPTTIAVRVGNGILRRSSVPASSVPAPFVTGGHQGRPPRPFPARRSRPPGSPGRGRSRHHS
ncbi:hypothetical protein GCM10010468_31150 [Actinocorallia longicatena]|uniref:Uncharacterized protein n=1 Tax=Actinocorallia longicatena TaxID=111803 RepID=A0ABP6Q9P6_9ACTN